MKDRKAAGKQQKASLSKKRQRKMKKFGKSKGGSRNVTRLSAAMYNKLKQADSLMAHDPNRRRRVNGVYGRLIELQSRIDELKQYGDSADDEELDRLTQEQHDILSQFDHVMEAGARRAAVDEWVPRSGRYWADEYDDDDSDLQRELLDRQSARCVR